METTVKNTALLVMDMQTAIAGMLPDVAGLTKHVSAAIAAARAHQMPVIYVVVGFRQGMPEVAASNKTFSLRKAQMATMNMEEWMRIHESVAPQAGDITVVKRRVSAFTGSDLEVVLRGQGIRHIVLAGVATSGVVLSTLREAADKDYVITVLSDCCADRDPEVHGLLMNKVFVNQADVMTESEWAKTLG